MAKSRKMTPAEADQWAADQTLGACKQKMAEREKRAGSDKGEAWRHARHHMDLLDEHYATVVKAVEQIVVSLAFIDNSLKHVRADIQKIEA